MKNATIAFVCMTFLVPSVASAKLVDGGASYVPPTAPLKVDNAREFSVPYDKAWKAVVAHLSETSFVIDNIDKDSGLITVSFSVSDPRTAVDCGQWSYWVKNLRGRRDYSNEGAAPYAKYEFLQDGTLTNIERSVALSGKFNILVTSPTDSTSRVKVTARFVQSITLKVAPLAVDMNFQRVAPRTFTESMGFTTGQEAQIPGGQTICRSNAKFELQILDSISDQFQVGAQPAA